MRDPRLNLTALAAPARAMGRSFSNGRLTTPRLGGARVPALELATELTVIKYAGTEALMERSPVKRNLPLEHRIAERVDDLRAQAEALPRGSKERELIERRVRLAETGSHINEWLKSPGLKSPT
jgi:hypothetical protein